MGRWGKPPSGPPDRHRHTGPPLAELQQRRRAKQQEGAWVPARPPPPPACRSLPASELAPPGPKTMIRYGLARDTWAFALARPPRWAVAVEISSGHWRWSPPRTSYHAGVKSFYPFWRRSTSSLCATRRPGNVMPQSRLAPGPPFRRFTYFTRPSPIIASCLEREHPALVQR